MGNITNCFYGDLAEISDEDLQHIDEMTMKNLASVPMQKGDVVLVDNYQVMHGQRLRGREAARRHLVPVRGAGLSAVRPRLASCMRTGNLLVSAVVGFLPPALCFVLSII